MSSNKFERLCQTVEIIGTAVPATTKNKTHTQKTTTQIGTKPQSAGTVNIA